MNFVLDASITLAWCFEDEGADHAVAVLGALRRSEAVVPTLWPLEVTNGLAVAERKGRLAAPDAARFIELVRALPIVVEPLSRGRTFSATYAMARRHGLSTYDAAYLELAARLGLRLATLDERLRTAAGDEGVALFGDG